MRIHRRHRRGETLRRVFYFFPLQLILLHLKRNHFILLVWLLLFGIVLGDVGEKFGFPNLFLYPEYLGRVDFWAYSILGFAVGGFTMAFHLHTYVAHSRKFPFIATLSRPFMKFSINNSVIPNVFALAHLYRIIRYQADIELESSSTILINVGGYIFGGLLFLLFSFFYFFRTNIDLYKLLRKRGKKKKHKETRFGKKKKWYPSGHPSTWHVETYISSPLRIRLARGSEHYEDKLLQRVFAQTHLNASFFEIAVIVSFIVIGSFRDIPFFMVPAGAAIFLLFTMILMLGSAIHSWVKGWSITLAISIILLLNYLSAHTTLFQAETRAYGMDYQEEPAPYLSDSLMAWRADRARVKEDRKKGIEYLENWKEKAQQKGDSLPRMLVLNVSGGGLRSALWTVRSLQHLDSSLSGRIMDRVALISGSSGGMLGAAYLREQRLREIEGKKAAFRDPVHRERIAQDLLNPVASSIVTTDLFIRYQEHQYQGKSYKRDRAHAFEKQLNSNTAGILDKPLKAYERPVRNADIPLLILSPSVINDGRRLLISSQPMSYMMDNRTEGQRGEPSLVEDVDFYRMFEDQGAEDLRFLSALRMNASFPYILPNTSLPCRPGMEVMDAGFRDNFGFRTSVRFLYQFRDWIEANTRGVLVLQIRDKGRDFRTSQEEDASLFEKWSRPVGSLYENLFRIQNHEQSLHFQQASTWLDKELDIVELELQHTKQDRISLSFHLTALEKKRILRAIEHEKNQEALEQLKSLLDGSS